LGGFVTDTQGEESITEKAPDHYDEAIKGLQDRHAELTGQIQESRETLAEMRGRLEAAPPAPPPKEFTREELNKAVEDETLTQSAADAILEKQLEARITRKAEERIAETTAAASQTAAQDAEVGQYTEAHPELKDKTSPKFQKVESEYQRLVASGLPKGRATEVAALKIALGPPDVLSDRTREARETHVETGGAGGGGGEKPPAVGENSVPKKYRAHYARMIDQGQYTGWNDPKIEAEKKYMRPG
jgi:hypothetical protein